MLRYMVAGFVEQHVHPVLAALNTKTKVISIEDWDAIDGFSPAVRDEKGYQDRPTMPRFPAPPPCTSPAC